MSESCEKAKIDISGNARPPPKEICHTADEAELPSALGAILLKLMCRVNNIFHGITHEVGGNIAAAQSDRSTAGADEAQVLLEVHR